MIENKEFKKNKKLIIIITSIIFIIAFIMIFFVEPSLVITNFKNRPESFSPQTSKNMKTTTYRLKRNIKNECFKFSKTEVFNLKNDLRGFFVDNKSDFVNGYFRILTTCKMLESIDKDVPELSAKAKEYLNKIDKIYGPVILQYLYCMDQFGLIKNLTPDEVYEKNINKMKDNYLKKNEYELMKYKDGFSILNEVDKKIIDLKDLLYNYIGFTKNIIPLSLFDDNYNIFKTVYNGIYNNEVLKYKKRNILFENRYPFLYGKKYTKEDATEFFKEVENITGKNGNYKDLIHFLLFHPKTISCDSDYILSNLCCGKTLLLNANNNFFNWSFLIPKYWDITLPKENDDILLMFYTRLDGISGGVGHYDNINTLKIESEEKFLNSLKDKLGYLNNVIALSNFIISNSSVVKLDDKNVLVVDYRGNKNNLFIVGRTYIFLSKYSILAYMFNIEGSSFEQCNAKMNINSPLFDKLVKASKLTYF